MNFLPLTKDEVRSRGWSEVDVVLVTGDAYIDHPSFGTAVIGRVLESRGYRVAVISMPPWQDPESIAVFGKPRLFFGVSAGNVDSQLSRFTAFGKVRNDDPYAPGGAGGMRPAQAVTVYCNMIRRAFKDVPIVIGGVEASMRRLPYYDFWSDRARRSVILDCRADILVYGMGERQIVEIASRLDRGENLSGIEGTVEIVRTPPAGAVMLPPEEEVIGDKEAFIRQYSILFKNQHRVLVQPTAARFLVQHPSPRMSSEELDAVYALPFTRLPHPSYGGRVIPAFEMIRCSVTSHRGCVSGCSFCSLSLHQGRRIVARSRESVLDEVKHLTSMDYFRGHVTDIGGPSANMFGYDCAKGWKCGRESCTFPGLCPSLAVRTGPWIDLLAEAKKISGVKHVTVGSGVRYDLLMRDDERHLAELMKRHVSGQLKIAPEHTSGQVLRAMRKRPVYPIDEFVGRFRAISRRIGKEEYLIPYLMSCHPGCGVEEMRSMREEVRSVFGYIPDQVQAFIPLPMTLSSVIYYTGVDPLTGERFFVERDPKKRRAQHDLFFK